jgi:hypothetical protein
VVGTYSDYEIKFLAFIKQECSSQCSQKLITAPCTELYLFSNTRFHIIVNPTHIFSEVVPFTRVAVTKFLRIVFLMPEHLQMISFSFTYLLF